MSAFVFSRQCFAHLFSARPGGDQSDKFLDRDRDAGAELREIPKTFFSVLLILLETGRLFGVGDLVPGRLSVRSLFGRDSDLFRLEMTLAGPHFRSCPSSGYVRLGEADRPGSLKSGNPLALLPPSYTGSLRERGLVHGRSHIERLLSGRLNAASSQSSTPIGASLTWLGAVRGHRVRPLGVAFRPNRIDCGSIPTLRLPPHRRRAQG